MFSASYLYQIELGFFLFVCFAFFVLGIFFFFKMKIFGFSAIRNGNEVLDTQNCSMDKIGCDNNDYRSSAGFCTCCCFS